MVMFLGQEMSRKELCEKIGNMSQLAYIRPFEMTEGRAQGIKAFEISTGGGLDFTVLENKCLDILDMKFKGINLSFVSKPGVINSTYFNSKKDEFLRYFHAGMLYTCGLSNIGVACEDDGEEHSIHGRIAHISADKVRVREEWDGEDYVLEVSGEMRQAAHFMENLVLKRTIKTKLGSKTVQIHDEVENQGFEKQPVLLLYHFNTGYPLLDTGARFIVPKGEVIPRTEAAKKAIADYDKITSPESKFFEHCYYHKSSSDKDGYSYGALINDKLGIGLYIKYNKKELPILLQWKSMASGDYALGIEPGSNCLEGRDKEREKGALRWLEPYEKSFYDIEIGVLEGSAEISEFENMIKEL